MEPSASSPKTYVEVTLQVDQRETDAAEAALLELGALGTALEIPRRAQAGSPAEVVGYFHPDAVPEAAETLKQFHLLRSFVEGAVQIRARQQPSPAAQPLFAPAVQIQTKPWLDWSGQARASFKPFQATPDLQIAPPWDVPAEPSGDLLVLHPGAAFGLGSHATTRGCLALIPSAASDIPRGPALDVGTGTGLLALRAAQCGFNPVIACDNDPLAVAAAGHNLALNKMEDQVMLFLGEAAAVGCGVRFALILANILLNPLLALVEDLERLLSADGQLIVAGIQEGDAAELLAAFEAVGLGLQDSKIEDGWSILRLGRVN